MKILFLVVGKTDDKYLLEGIEKYRLRLKHYIGFDYVEIPDIKNRKSLSESQQKKQESDLIFAKLKVGDHMVLLDEKGQVFRSLAFANHLQQKMNSGIKRLVFVVGGPYGFDDSLYVKAQGKVSLSKMTFSHQMIRLFFVEQVYRAMTILRNEPYHHE
ncbi:23S rRNA (pseudouridine(1915)-N(3))-methyltransferase RlmH [Flavobacteriales bacterium]|jgi:23S rRNA (pseudouridine1915-N3)-methyltransferase|nr:23S rRNA (pseudouridine(1915)-N(3))-methyltransferase RlmH [Flavobacteriales bacterium]MDB2622420.1 23S rRNA (pseudouridine(1915)-N(3))-methyltransferase RlmH [Flavobacteriales bacterium]